MDIRSLNKKLIIHHDPFNEGVEFDDWIKSYNHSFLILNVKEEGLESILLEKMKAYGIKNFFFLDQSIPFLLRTAIGGEKRCAVRVSEYESIENAMLFSGLVEWVWIDTFNKLPISNKDFKKLREGGFKLCLVSPELQGHHIDEINNIQKKIDYESIEFDAVCTKSVESWIAFKLRK